MCNDNEDEVTLIGTLMTGCVYGAIKEHHNYVYALEEVEKTALREALVIPNLPMLIRTLSLHPGIHSEMQLRNVGPITTATSEYHGLRDGKPSYEVWHSVGSLATSNGLLCAFYDLIVKHSGRKLDILSVEDLERTPHLCEYFPHGFMPIYNDEWEILGRGNYNDQDVVRVHFDDLRKGDSPSPDTWYTVTLPIPEDHTFIPVSADTKSVRRRHRQGKLIMFERGYLSKDQFLLDDRILALSGSLENREALTELCFSRFEGKLHLRRDINQVYNDTSSFDRVGFDSQARGRLVYLSNSNQGVGGDRSSLQGGFIALDYATLSKNSGIGRLQFW